MRTLRAHPQGGMSLVELMVAVLLLALMSVLGWRALDGILRARAGLDDQLAQLRGHQLAFAQMEADCARLVASRAFDGQPTMSVAGGRLMLLRGVAEGMQIVVYRSEGGALIRSTSAATRDLDLLHAAWRAAAAGADGFGGVTLDAQVASFDIMTWSGGGWQAAGAVPAGGAGAPARPRTRRVVRPPSTDAAGLQVALRQDQRAWPLVRMFMLGAG